MASKALSTEGLATSRTAAAPRRARGAIVPVMAAFA